MGSRVFNLQDTYPVITSPQISEKLADGGRSHDFEADPIELLNRCAELPRSVDLWGYFQLHTAHYRGHKELFRDIFTPNDEM